MADPAFVHLRMHSEFSIVDGIVRIDDAVARASAERMPALALTDLSNLFGAIKFYSAARGAGIKPIVGCDLWIANPAKPEVPHRLLLLVRSHAGYLRLCELLTRAYRENQQRGRAEVRMEWLHEAGTEGLIALSSGQAGEIGESLAKGSAEAARAAASRLAALFPDAFYVEIQRTGAPGQAQYVDAALDLAQDLSLPVVATHPIQFLKPEDFKAHEARVCIAGGYMLGDPRRPHEFTARQYFTGQAEMVELFADVPEALANAVEIAKRCNLELTLGKPRLPEFPTPPGMTLDTFMRERSEAGLEARLAVLFPDETERERQRPAYRDRLEIEIGTIVQMGFSGYFLIVADFINWAKDNGVPVGPGRGSGAGSLVAYSLGITDLDPLRYDLLFERFLNPERVSMPDFDVDFCQDGRERVIDYVKQKYGADSVSQIATFGTMAAKAVVRDVGRVLDLPYSFVDQLAKLIPFALDMTLKIAREQEPQLNERAAREEEVAELLELAESLEGITRGVGMHAGGVLIAPGRLTDFTPLYGADGAESLVSQYDKDDVEKVGLVKFDFLGLRTLTILDWAVRFIRQLQAVGKIGPKEAPPFDLLKIPLDDPATYRIFTSGNTTAVFQSESRSAKDLEKRLRPDNFEDIIALMALNRPGPLQSGMVDDFIDRKHGRAKADYFHPKLEPVLSPTYGVIVYQEQVMQVAQILAGYSLGSADLLRRAMGKKKPEEMAQQRVAFTNGAVERGVDADLAKHLFDLMEKFAEYGFNKSHSAAYALVAYQTAFLKAHFPSAFMAATLSADMDDTDKVHVFYEDCVANGIRVLPPDINASDYRFVPTDVDCMRYGLGAVKGTGQTAVEHIVAERARGGPYRDLFDFCRRIDKRVVNRRVVESLIRAGAFDSLDDHRARLFASVGAALEAAEQASRNANQNSLFDFDADPTTPAVPLVQVAPWTELERLQHEKACLGFYYSGHPFTAYRTELGAFVRRRLSDVQPQPDPILIAGIVSGLRMQQTRRGRMAVVELDDGSGKLEVAIFNELFDKHRGILKEDAVLVVEGKAAPDHFTGGVRVSADVIMDLAAARERFAKALRLRVNGNADAGKLQRILEPFMPGQCPVRIEYHNGQAACELDIGKARLAGPLVSSLSEWLSPENVNVLY
jgi:DNA polymerase III subunit alpha